MKHVNLDELVGKSGILCAVNNYQFRIGDLTFEAVEDENDGYRSTLDYVQIVDNLRPTFREEVTIKNLSGDAEGIELVNKLGYSVLKVGTKNYDDYYPYFLFDWNPDKLTENVKLDYDELFNRVTEC